MVEMHEDSRGRLAAPHSDAMQLELITRMPHGCSVLALMLEVYVWECVVRTCPRFARVTGPQSNVGASGAHLAPEILTTEHVPGLYV